MLWGGAPRRENNPTAISNKPHLRIIVLELREARWGGRVKVVWFGNLREDPGASRRSHFSIQHYEHIGGGTFRKSHSCTLSPGWGSSEGMRTAFGIYAEFQEAIIIRQY
jgi:hypothetical protein